MAHTVPVDAKILDQILSKLNKLDKLVKDVEELKTKLLDKKSGGIPMVDEETEKRIGQALRDYEEGRYTTISTNKELKEHLASLRG